MVNGILNASSLTVTVAETKLFIFQVLINGTKIKKISSINGRSLISSCTTFIIIHSRHDCGVVVISQVLTTLLWWKL